MRVSIIGFDSGLQQERVLNGQPVSSINADLTGLVDTTQARRLVENSGIAFMGAMPAGPFDIDTQLAQAFLAMPANVNGRTNADVVRPVVNAHDLVQHNKRSWTVDFGTMPMEEAAFYEGPFEHIKQHVYPVRQQNRRSSYSEKWWQYAEARPGMRAALRGKRRFIATPRVAKHRIFVWLDAHVLPTNKVCVLVREDDYFFGVLQSHVHETWSLATASRHGDGSEGGRPIYNNTTCFETYPFPWPPAHEPQGGPSRRGYCPSSSCVS